MVSKVIGKVFGGDEKQAQRPLNKFRPSNINAGGLVSSGASTVNVRSSGHRRNLFKSLSDTFGRQASELGELKSTLKPGFGSITNARVNTIRDRSRSAISDLSANLASRRIKGSSFGQDALSRAKAEFAREEADVRAQSFLEELDATVNLINQEAAAQGNSYQALIDNMNIEANLAAQLASQATSVMAANAQAQSNAAAQAQSSRGSLFGTVLGAATNLYGYSKLSDMREKKDIKQIGKLGQYKIYLYKYIKSGIEDIGVLAQEVLKINPKAVSNINGTFYVNYGEL